LCPASTRGPLSATRGPAWLGWRPWSHPTGLGGVNTTATAYAGAILGAIAFVVVLTLLKWLLMMKCPALPILPLLFERAEGYFRPVIFGCAFVLLWRESHSVTLRVLGAAVFLLYLKVAAGCGYVFGSFAGFVKGAWVVGPSSPQQHYIKYFGVFFESLLSVWFRGVTGCVRRSQ